VLSLTRERERRTIGSLVKTAGLEGGEKINRNRHTSVKTDQFTPNFEKEKGGLFPGVL